MNPSSVSSDIDRLVQTVSDLDRRRAALEVSLAHTAAELQSHETEIARLRGKHEALSQQLAATQREHERVLLQNGAHERELEVARQTTRHLLASVAAVQEKLQGLLSEQEQEQQGEQQEAQRLVREAALYFSSFEEKMGKYK